MGQLRVPDRRRAIYEVDLLVLTKLGFWLVETKAWAGRIAGDAAAWTCTHEGHTRSEDLDRLNKFRDKNERHRTIVWLPSFFSPRTQAELGKLVIIDRLLLGTNLDQHAKHLSLQDRQTARLLLQNQQSALSQRLLQAVEAACGSSAATTTPTGPG